MKKRNKYFIKKIKYKLTLFLIFIPFIYLVYIIVNSIDKDVKFYFSDLKVTKAIIIDKKNYSHTKRISDRFSYSYEFYLDGKRFENDSHKYGKYNVGQVILIEFISKSPKYNRVKKN